MSVGRPVIAVVGESVVDADVRPGGSSYNVAVGLGRLGVSVELVTDPEADGASAGGAWGVAGGAICVHAGSIAAGLGSGADKVRRVFEWWGGRATVSYDPKCRRVLMADRARVRARVERLVGLADVVKAGDVDLRWLYPQSDHIEVADAWFARGPALVVVTLGARGAYGLCRSGVVTCPARAVEVVDTVGAGDAFTAGLLRALADRDLLGPAAAERLRGLSTMVLGELLDESSVVAALTCGRAGADVPTTAEVARTALRRV